MAQTPNFGTNYHQPDYEPLPLTQEGYPAHALYNAPLAAQSSTFSIPSDQHGVPYTDDISGIPMGGGQPRFIGRYEAPSMRNSYAASQHSYQASTAESIYGLNENAAPPAGGGWSNNGYRDDPPGGFYPNEQPVRTRGRLDEKRAAYTHPRSRKKIIIVAVIVCLLLAGGVVAALMFTVFKKSDDSSNNKDSGAAKGNTAAQESGGVHPGKKLAVVTGTDGSAITKDDGTSFKYTNSFGGTWYWDANDPFNNGARPQSWSPALNETFNFGVDKIRGVNVGGWLVTEPFICPGLYQTIQSRPTTASANITIIDEWTLITAMKLDVANGGINQMEDHYKTFITEEDFMQIAAAGLNFVRIPLGYWAIEVLDGEEFLPKVSWTYFLKAVEWCRKYGLRVNLDLHGLPGSQNGWNHSGRLGSFNVLFGPMGMANAQRALNYIRILAEFISQPQYKDVVAIFGITNEPQGTDISVEVLEAYYLEAYRTVRSVTGVGAGKGPYVSFHDGFLGIDKFNGFLPGADRASMDSHPYLCFGGQNNNPITGATARPCQSWGASFNNSMGKMGLTVAGEFSNALTDCGLYVNGVGQGVRYEGNYNQGGPWPVIGDCATDWLDYPNWDANTKEAYKQFALSSMDALQNWFFWTWKIGESIANKVEAPHWSYKLGLDNGWMPTDPRDAYNKCQNANPWVGPLPSWNLGGDGADQIPADVLQALAWPPASIKFSREDATAVALLPTFTQTGPLISLPAPTPAPSATATVDPGNGWANAADQVGLYVPIPTCQYLDPWVGTNAALPPQCGAPAAPPRRAFATVRAPVAGPTITPAP